MAQLRNLGQPFGSPGGIINIPAPAGAALAGQIQMQQLERLGQSIGQALGQRKQQQLWEQDVQNWQLGQQSQLPQGMVGPQMGMPQMQSRMGQQAQVQGQLESMFGDPLEREYLQKRIEAIEASTEQRREPESLEDKYKYWLDRRARAEGRDPLTGLLTGTRNEGDLELIDKKLGIIRKQFEKRDEIEKRAAAERIRKQKPPPPKRDTTVVPGRFYRGPNITKEQFDSTFRMLKTPKQKQQYINDSWRPEFGRYLK